jgi:hypothetical protein
MTMGRFDRRCRRRRDPPTTGQGGLAGATGSRPARPGATAQQSQSVNAVAKSRKFLKAPQLDAGTAQRALQGAPAVLGRHVSVPTPNKFVTRLCWKPHSVSHTWRQFPARSVLSVRSLVTSRHASSLPSHSHTVPSRRAACPCLCLCRHPSNQDSPHPPSGHNGDRPPASTGVRSQRKARHSSCGAESVRWAKFSPAHALSLSHHPNPPFSPPAARPSSAAIRASSCTWLPRAC